MSKKYYAAVPLTLTRADDVKDRDGVKPELRVGEEFKVQKGYTADDLARLEADGFLTTKAPAEVPEDKPAA